MLLPASLSVLRLRSRHFSFLPYIILVLVVPSAAKVQGSGDFNHDEYADVCIGAILHQVGTKTGAGAVNCLYGSPSGLQATGTPAAQLWTQDNVGVQDISAEGAEFGFALASGDFNGDGYDDLCIGIPNETQFGFSRVGAVNCIYGSAAGLQATGIGGPKPQLWGYPALDLVPLKDLEIGQSVIAGDFNHDSFADLCIGITGATINGVQGAGEVKCLYGSPTGLTANGAQIWSEGTSGVGGKPALEDQFGTNLVAGDFNNDSFDDLCVGF